MPASFLLLLLVLFFFSSSSPLGGQQNYHPNGVAAEDIPVITIPRNHDASPLQCSDSAFHDTTEKTSTGQQRDPNLVEMEYDLGFGDGPQTFWAYVQPNVTSFYGDKPAPSSSVVPMKHKGLAAKFINLSKDRVIVSWSYDSEGFAKGKSKLARVVDPFSAKGTGAWRGHNFFFAKESEPTKLLVSYKATQSPDNLMFYDPYIVEGDDAKTQANLDEALTAQQQEYYWMYRKTIAFSEKYKSVTGRSYLSSYLRAPPAHFMWPADFFGQEHWVMTRETHFQSIPPHENLKWIQEHGKARQIAPYQPRLLQEHRDQPDGGQLNMTLKVVSVAPRVFEIPNFLSGPEIQHIINIGREQGLDVSTTGDRTMEKQQVHASRTSRNTWVTRERSAVIDAVYRRAADLLRMDEALLRNRPDRELPEIPSMRAICEQLQLVHYDVAQEYTAHHDFAYVPADDAKQEARYVTLLLYLNEGMRGGETTFPRWANAETFEQLKIVPEAGKAALFYNILPDGNMDDLSQHEARKIIAGDKWLINLWVWDPYTTG